MILVMCASVRPVLTSQGLIQWSWKPALWSDFLTICACGGRLAGSAGETRAVALLAQALQAVSNRPVERVPVAYRGWQAEYARLSTGGQEWPCHPLIRTVGTAELTAEVLDLGRGTEESFAAGLLEYPQYTRPQMFEGRAIPAVLTSGDHAKIAAWRRAEAERLTRDRRPDLWAAHLAGSAKKPPPEG